MEAQAQVEVQVEVEAQVKVEAQLTVFLFECNISRSDKTPPLKTPQRDNYNDNRCCCCKNRDHTKNNT